ncbi:MAG: substrate-binding periplasmic protein, partial [Bryobacteraceae bacterium]
MRFPKVQLWWLAVPIAAGLLAGWHYGHRRVAVVVNRPLRIGYEQSPPLHYIDPTGKPAGAAVDLINEAARRRGIPLQWVAAPEGPDAAIAAGKVDLWPVIGDVPERRQLFHITAPWRTVGYWLATLQGSGITGLRDTAGRRVAHSSKGGTARRAKLLRDASLVGVADPSRALSAVCTGTADAALISDGLSEREVFKLPAECEKASLDLIAMPELTLYYGMAARRERESAVWAADALREEFGSLARDGTLNKIFFRFFLRSSRDTLIIDERLADQRLSRILLAGLFLLAAVLVYMKRQWRRVRAAKRAADEARVAAERA